MRKKFLHTQTPKESKVYNIQYFKAAIEISEIFGHMTLFLQTYVDN